MRFARYAIYYTCPQGPLANFGAAWLGWNPATGERPDPPDVDGLPAPSRELTATPRKYGLHGTIKPPFRLAEGQDFDALHAAFNEFCARQAPARTDGLALSRLGSFLALTPQGDTGALTALAGRAVQELDSFRAPLSELELARRRKARLSENQEAHLQAWGYPYVLDEFRFHITLTGRLPSAEAEQVRAALAPHLKPVLPEPFVIDALTLCGEDRDGLFHELHRVPLGGSA